MILCDLLPTSQGHDIFEVEYLRDKVSVEH